MSRCIKSKRLRLGMLWGALSVSVVAAAMTANAVRAQTVLSADVYRVEEDWQLVVTDADSDINSPQITCMISPATLGTMYCAFDLNYHTQPDYVPGGLQVHTWDPTDPIAYSSSWHTQVMSSSDTVTWTQTMTLDPNLGVITFEVINGQSQTWGTFGGTGGKTLGHLALSISTGLPNLDTYDPNVSLDNSGVSFGGNLVTSQT